MQGRFSYCRIEPKLWNMSVTLLEKWVRCDSCNDLHSLDHTPKPHGSLITTEFPIAVTGASSGHSRQVFMYSDLSRPEWPALRCRPVRTSCRPTYQASRDVEQRAVAFRSLESLPKDWFILTENWSTKLSKYFVFSWVQIPLGAWIYVILCKIYNFTTNSD